jgi:hypothetical protein
VVRFRPRWDVAPAFQERRESIEVTILRNQGDPAFPTRCGKQGIIEKRWIVMDCGPTFAGRHGGEQAPTLDERHRRGRKDLLPFQEWPEDRVLELTCLGRRSCAGRELLHHNGAEERERQGALEKTEDCGFSGGIAKRVDEDTAIAGFRSVHPAS